MKEKEIKQTKEEIEKLTKQINALNKSQSPLITKRNKLRNKVAFQENQKYVGKCYKTKNGDVSDKWWMYQKIIKILDDYSLIALRVEFVKKNNDKIRYEVEEVNYPISYFTSGYYNTEISEKLFNKKFNIAIEKLKKRNEVCGLKLKGGLK